MKASHFDLEKIINDITNRLLEDVETGRLYTVVVDIAMEATSAKACSLYLEDLGGNADVEVPQRIVLVAGAGFERSRVNKAAYHRGEGLTGTIWQNGEWIKCDTKKDIEDPVKGWIGKYNSIVRDDLPHWESTSLIGGPLVVGLRTIGVLKLENKDPTIAKHFSDDDLSLLKIIAGIISLAIQNRRNLEQSYSKIFGAIIDASDMILGKQVIPVSILRQEILHKCLSIFNAEASSLYLEETGHAQQPPTLKMVAGEGYEKKRIGIANYQKGEGLTGRIWRDGKSVKFDTQHDIENSNNGWLGKYNDVVKDSQAQWVCSSLMGVPLKIGERTLGVLKVENKRPSPQAHFTYDELRSLEIFASFIAFSLEMLRSHSELFHKGENARGVIHTLNNIVHGIQYQADRVQSQCNGGCNAGAGVPDSISKMRAYIGEVIHAFDRHELVSEVGKRVTCFNNLLARNVDVFSALAKDAGVKFAIPAPMDLLYVNVIEDYIDMAIRNILSNAIDALSGVADPEISVAVETSHEESLQKLTLTICDNGPGLNEEQIKSLRERAPIRSSKHSWPGSGLAESQFFFKANEVSFEYIENSDMRNKLGGACFEMGFMMCKPGKVKVLVIDDDKATLDCFETHFGSQTNIEINTSLSPAEFIEIVRSNTSYATHRTLREYDWIFLDCELSCDLDGPALFRLIKTREPSFVEKVLLMSIHKTYVSETPEQRVYSKYDEILKESNRNRFESDLMCGRRP